MCLKIGGQGKEGQKDGRPQIDQSFFFYYYHVYLFVIFTEQSLQVHMYINPVGVVSLESSITSSSLQSCCLISIDR